MLNMYQNSPTPGKSSLPHTDQLGFWTGTTNRRALRVANPNIDARPDIPPVPEIEPGLDLPPQFRRFLARYQKDYGFKAAINWYQKKLTASDVQDRDTAGLTELEEILRRDTRRSATSTIPHWVPMKELGKGKYGKVVLWERKMGTSKVRLHCWRCKSIKLTDLQQPEHVACKDSKFDAWFHDYCTEAHLTRRLNAAGCVNIVKVLDWISIQSKKLNRILYEYCPHGTLYDLYQFYKTEWQVAISLIAEHDC